ncbi:regulatory LuxR family protein [Actinomadura pelletieri DSM 43383]|uniref:Regulatory LuxR family protein n=1 Tax=Actinomadura pelletieri DSM 43383 TaxID=1120940 RepID=A0A495QGE8_9ACTN|nr:helix-turn-helix transcriptional regulator [Actinomadura pelletieri]RKS70987.1 regulatory LuxR family protein [Actinomadura pelletieri DSM 43383]
MDSQTLDLDDYQRIFRVLETSADAVGQDRFFERLGDALARHLDWKHALVTTGTPPTGRRPRPENFARTLSGTIEATPNTRVLISVCFPYGPGPGERERAILRRLQSHLAPWLSEHLSGVRRNTALISLTRREEAVVRLVAQGMSNRRIADRLGVTTDTVKKHLTHAMAKAGCRGRAQLALWWHDHEPA